MAGKEEACLSPSLWLLDGNTAVRKKRYSSPAAAGDDWSVGAFDRRSTCFRRVDAGLVVVDHG